MRRLSLVLGSLLVFVLAMPVSAATVDRYKVVIDFGFSDTACGFVTLGEVTLNNEYQKDFYDNDGNLVKSLVNGRLQVTITNPDNGKSIVESLPGAAHLDYEKGEFFFTGRNGWFAHVITGRIDLNDFTFTGHLSNEICEALA